MNMLTEDRLGYCTTWHNHVGCPASWGSINMLTEDRLYYCTTWHNHVECPFLLFILLSVHDNVQVYSGVLFSCICVFLYINQVQ